MHKRSSKIIYFVPSRIFVGVLVTLLTLIASQIPATANDAVTSARAELAATMAQLETAKTNQATAEKELSTAQAAAAKIDQELKAAQAALALVQAEMDALNVQIAKDQATLDEIVRTSYKMGVSKEWLIVDVIISSDSDENITRKLELLYTVLDSSNEVLGLLIKAKAELEVKVAAAEEIQVEIELKNNQAQELVAELAVKAQKAKDEANRVQLLVNEKESVLRKLVFAGLPTSGTILGADISLWQHPGNREIDFIKMYDGGIRFLYIKGSSGGDGPNATALRWASIDLPKAREAGLLTGIYHAGLIAAGSSVESAAAQGSAQANRAVANMNSLGGYKPGILPIALDIEGFSLAGGKGTPSAVVTSFVNGFLSTVRAQTGRNAVIYSNLSFIGTYLKDPNFKNYPLWVANYSSGTNPSALSNGTCIATPWTSAGCVMDWFFWQYTDKGPATNYGIYSGGLDLNRLGKSINELLALAGY
jgi:lysozyme